MKHHLKKLCTTIIAIMLMAGCSLPSSQVQAATVAELQIMVSKLMIQLASLNGGNSVVEYAHGDKIANTATVRVRAGASLTAPVLGSQLSSVTGTIEYGPVMSDGYIWYRVNFVTGIDGWVASANFSHSNLTNNNTSTSLSFAISGKSLKAAAFTGNTIKDGKVTLLTYEIKAEDKRREVVDLKTLAVGISTNGVSFDRAVNDVALYIDGKRFDDVTFTTVGEKTIAIVNLDGGVTLGVDDVIEVDVKAELKAVQGGFTVQAFVTDYERSLTKAKTSEDVNVFRGLAVGTVHTIEGSLPTPIKTCLNLFKSYKEGDKLQSITVNGKESSVFDASYVCRNGIWKIEGSLPTPIKTCLNLFKSYKEGDKLQSITVNGKESSVFDASYVCRNGIWKIEGSLPILKTNY